MIASSFPADLNPSRFASRRAQYEPNASAIVYDGGDLTCLQLDQKVGSLAAALTERGVVRSDRVAFLGLNSSTFVVTFLAAQRIGAIFVPINFRLAAPEVTEILAVSGAQTIVCEEGHRELVESITDSPLKIHLLIDDDPSIPISGEHDPRWELLSGALEGSQNVPSPAVLAADDVAVLMFTSGTTGKPKGVVLTAGNIWFNGVNVDMMVDTRRDDVTLSVAPLFHIGGLNAFTVKTLCRGGTVVIRRTFDPVRTLTDLVTLGVNSMFAVPAMLAAMARTPGFFDANLTQLRSTVVAGAPVPPSLIAEFAQHGILLQQAWGLTETAPFATYLPAEMTFHKLGSAGIPMPFTEVAIVDAFDPTASPPAGIAGEIVVRGANVTPGYWQNSAATAAAFDADGWFHSGDVGYLDDDGFLFIVDRLKDMIISGGENVYPAEVESSLADMPGVLDVAVIGTPDARWGETVVAVVAVDGSGSVTIEAVREHASRKLARYKLPTELRLVDAVPRNASGKLDKIRIRELAASGADGDQMRRPGGQPVVS